jgi:hemolysin D
VTLRRGETQPLIDLDPPDASADACPEVTRRVDRLERERLARGIDVARLESLLGGGPADSPFVAPDGADAPMLDAAQQRLQSQWRERTAKLAALDSETCPERS